MILNNNYIIFMNIFLNIENMYIKYQYIYNNLIFIKFFYVEFFYVITPDSYE